MSSSNARLDYDVNGGPGSRSKDGDGADATSSSLTKRSARMSSSSRAAEAHGQTNGHSLTAVPKGRLLVAQSMTRDDA